LLEKSGQIIVKDINDLNNNITDCLEYTSQYIKTGYKYASKYDLDYFKSSWTVLIDELD